MSSGELAATVMVDAVYRLIDGVISSDSLAEESHSDGLLEYPQYTRPEVYKGLKVPEVLLSGNHELIRKWRLKKRLEKTLRVRPDMIWEARRNNQLSLEAELMIEEITEQTAIKNCKKKQKMARRQLLLLPMVQNLFLVWIRSLVLEISLLPLRKSLCMEKSQLI